MLLPKNASDAEFEVAIHALIKEIQAILGGRDSRVVMAALASLMDIGLTHCCKTEEDRQRAVDGLAAGLMMPMEVCDALVAERRSSTTH